MCSLDIGTGKEVIPNSFLALGQNCMGWKKRGGTVVNVVEIKWLLGRFVCFSTCRLDGLCWTWLCGTLNPC